MTGLGIGLRVLVVLAITALTGYFVAQEFAYMAVDRSRLKVLADAGDAAAGRALQITRRTSFMLSGAQLGITVTGLLVGYIAEPLIGDGVGGILGGAGVPTGMGVAIGAVLGVLFSTVVQMVFGELFPKNLAIARPEPVARRLSRSTTIYLALFGWLIKLFDASSNLCCARYVSSQSMTWSTLQPHATSSTSSPNRARPASCRPNCPPCSIGSSTSPHRTAEHDDSPCRSMSSAPTSRSQTMLAKMAGGHLPVIDTSPDELLGVVHLQDLLKASRTGTARSVCRRPVIVPTTLPLPLVLAQLANTKGRDGPGHRRGTAVSPVSSPSRTWPRTRRRIADEHDPVDDEIVRLEDGWLLRGDVHLDEVARTVGHAMPGCLRDPCWLGHLRVRRSTWRRRLRRHRVGPRPAELAQGIAPVRRFLRAEVRGIERRVPCSVFVAVLDDADSDIGAMQ